MNLIVNGQPHVASVDASVAALLEQLGLADRPVAVEVNFEVVPKARHAEHRLADGDRLEVVSLVGGG